MIITLIVFSNQMLERGSLQNDRTESEIYARAVYLKGMTENNVSHIARCQSTEPPYTERYVQVVWEVENKSEVVSKLWHNLISVGELYGLPTDRPGPAIHA